MAERIKPSASMQDAMIGFSSDYSLVDPRHYQANAVEASGPQIAAKIGDILLGNLPPVDHDGEKKKVLDVASGTGIVTHRLKEIGYDVLSCDLNQNMLLYAAQHNPDISALRMDMNENFPVRNNSVDGIVTLWANRFINEVDHFSYEAYRVLKPAGILVWPTIPAEFLIWKIRAGFKTPTTASGVKKRLEKTGFEVSQINVPMHEVIRRSITSDFPSGFLVAKK